MLVFDIIANLLFWNLEQVSNKSKNLKKNQYA